MGNRTAAAFFASFCLIVGSDSVEGRDALPSWVAPSSDEQPLGLWVWRAEAANSDLFVAIRRDAGEWKASVDQALAPVTFEQGVVTLEGPNGSSFVGELSDDESEIRGYWYQVPAALGYQYVATPAALPADGKGRWQANVSTQPRPFRVFLDVFEDENGVISAVIRNPERNENHRTNRFRVEASDDGWSLVSGSGEYERRYRLERGEGGGLLLEFNRFDEPILLTPASDTAGYYSWDGREQPAMPTSPPQLNDGWQVADPEEAGFDAAALRALTTELASEDPRSQRHQMIHSVLVAHSGQLVYEEYFFGHNRETRHDVRSLGKVFGSILVGALQQQGHAIDASHRPIQDVLEGAGHEVDDPRKADIMLGHLLTFSSGLDCDSSGNSAGAEWRMWEQEDELNYWVFTSQLEMLHDPGVRYAYCSGSANLVGASLSAFGGARVHELFEELVARPLSFGPYHFALSPNGEGYLGGGAYVRPRDILKLGAMYLAGGKWNGVQIIDEDWVEQSPTPRIDISIETTGLSTDDFNDNYWGGSQAYIWRVDTVTAGARTYASYEASGNGGQLLIVVPELDLTVAFSGGNYRQGGIWGRWRNNIVGGHIIPAMKDVR